MLEKTKKLCTLFFENRFFIPLLLFFSFFLNIGYLPLFYEEPRRTIVALEMIFRGNYLLPTLGGKVFFDHPPAWAWIQGLSYQVFGFSDVTPRILSLFFHFLIASLLFFAGKAYCGKEKAFWGAIFYLVSGDIYLFYSFLGEMDLFFAFLVFSSFLLLFLGIEKKKKTYIVSSFAFTALAWLTKGPVSLVFLEVGYFSYSLFKRNLRFFFSSAHVLGFSLFCSLVGLYYWRFSFQADLSYAFEALVSIVSSKSVGNFRFSQFLFSWLSFPFKLFAWIFPASLFSFCLFSKRGFAFVRRNSLLEFFLLVTFSNLLVYFLSPGVRGRYLFPLFPMLVFLLVATFQDSEFKEKKKWLKGLLVFMLFLKVVTAVFHVPYREYKNSIFSNSKKKL